MLTSSMPPPTGYSSSRISSRSDEISYSAETPPVVQLAGVALGRAHHCLRPWLIQTPTDLHSERSLVPGRVHTGIEWISVTRSIFSGGRASPQRLIHNARPVVVMRPRRFNMDPDVMMKIAINDGDFILEAPFPGIHVPVDGLYCPPGSLQIVVDNQERQVISAGTTLPFAEQVDHVPCSGWCRKQHIYTQSGMVEMSVVFFDRNGWPIACRENHLDGTWTRSGVTWWRFSYSRPQPDVTT